MFLPEADNRSFRSLMNDAAKAIDYLAALGRTVQTVTYRQIASKPHELNAEIVFHLQPNSAR